MSLFLKIVCVGGLGVKFYPLTLTFFAHEKSPSIIVKYLRGVLLGLLTGLLIWDTERDHSHDLRAPRNPQNPFHVPRKITYPAAPHPLHLSGEDHVLQGNHSVNLTPSLHNRVTRPVKPNYSEGAILYK